MRDIGYRMTSTAKNVYVLIYITVFTFAPKSSTSSMNFAHIKTRKQIRPSHSTCQGPSKTIIRSFLGKILCSSIFPFLTLLYKKIKVNPRSLFEQSWKYKYLSIRCHISGFKAIGSGKEDFKVFYHLWAVWRRLYMKFGYNWPSSF